MNRDTATNLVAGAFVALTFVLFLLFIPMVMGIVGAISGYGFALLFPSSATALNTLLGLDYAYQSGALLGLIAGFFTRRS